MHPHQTRRLFILSFILFAIATISIIGGRAFNGAQTRPWQAVPTVPVSLTSQKDIGGQRRFGPVRADSPAQTNPFDWRSNSNSAFSYGGFFVPNITTNKVATLAAGGDVSGNGFVNPGDTLLYTVTIGNSGTEATGVSFTDMLSNQTTLVGGSLTVTPLPTNDSYDTIGNTQLQVAAAQSVLPAVFVSGNVLSNDIDPRGAGLTASVASPNTTLGGTVVMNTNGTFTYTPPVGTTGATDTFTYTVTSGTTTATATVSITLVSRVWYVKNNAAAGGLGRSGDPFDTLAEAQTASTVNDIIYVFTGDGTTTGQSLGIVLKAGQRLLGEGVALTVPVSVNGGPNPTVLRAAGVQPMLNNTTAGGSGVSATNVIPAEIAGLNLAGNTNAIDVTLSVALTGTLLIHDNTVRAAGVEGIDINSGTTGALTLGVYENLLTSTGTALDIDRAAGTLTIVAFHDNVVSGNTGGSGIVVTGTGGVVTFDAIPGSPINPVPGGTLVIGASGNGVGGNGMVLTNVVGELTFANSAMGTIGAGDLDIFADGGAALSVTGGVGGFNFSVTPNASTLVAVGPAATIATANINLQLNSLTSTNSAATGVSLTTVTGTFSAPTGSSITNATGTDFFISGGTATVTYNGTITDDVGQLVSISSTTGTKTFTGAITDGDDGDGSGISLSSNTGATITFSGGLTLSTGGNAAFSATGGGTVNVCDENPCNPGATGGLINKLTTTTATALNVANTTIGANKLEFRSISSNGGSAAGIILNTTGTSGGLVVTGTGAAGTGGTIANKTGINIWSFSGGIPSLNGTTVGVGVYLNNTRGTSLSWMQLNDFSNAAISAFSSSNFSLSNSVISGANGEDVAQSESAIFLYNLTGTGNISNSTIGGGNNENIYLLNTSGTLNRMTVTGSTFNFNSTAEGNNSILVESRNAGTTLNFTLQTSTIKGARADWINVSNNSSSTGDTVINGNTFDNLGANAHPGAAAGSNRIVFGGVGNSTVDINGNTTKGSKGEAIRVRGTATGTTTGTVNARVRNNTIGVQATANSGSSEGSGIFIFGDGGSDMVVAITNNNVYQYNNHGISLTFGDELNNGSSFAVTVTGNTVSNPGTLNNDFNGFHLNNGTVAATDDFTTCLHLSGNTLTGSGDGSIYPNNAEFRLRQRQNTTVILPGYGGLNDQDCNVIAFIAAQNTVSNSAAGSCINGTPNPPNKNGAASTQNATTALRGFEGGASCTAPSFNFAPPIETDEQLRQQSGNTAQQTVGGKAETSLLARVSQWLYPVFASFITPTSHNISFNISGNTSGNSSDKPAPEQATGAMPRATGYANSGAGASRSSQLGVKQLEPPVLAAFATPRSYFDLSRLDNWLTPTIAAAERLPAESNQTSATINTATGSPTDAGNKVALVSGSIAYAAAYGATPVAAGRAGLVKAAATAPSAAMAADVTVNGTGTGFTLPAGRTVTITYKAMVNLNTTATSVTNTAQVTGNFTTQNFSATTEVIQPPTISKVFGASFIRTNSTTSLTFTLTNPNPAEALSQVTFSDSLGVGSGLVVATPNGATTTCGGTVTAAAGGNSISFSGGSIPQGGSCTVKVDVQGTSEGAKPNTPGAPDSLESDAGVNGQTVTLNVINAPTFTKAFAPTSIPINTTSTLSFTITNNSTTFPLNGVGFTDTLPAGVEVAATPNITGTCFGGTITAVAGTGTISLSGATVPSSGTCTFSVSVRGTTAGSKSNSVNLATTELGSNSSVALATATLSVFAPPTITKTFSPTSIAVNGISTLTITILTNDVNPGGLTGIAVSDSFPAGLEVDATPMATNTCGGTFTAAAGATSINLTGGAIATAGGSCAISIKVKGTTAGAKLNTTGNVSSTEGGAGNTASATLNVFAATTATTGVIINELRTSGPGGAGDDFVELYNNTNGAIQVQASDASGGWAVVKAGATCASAPIVVATIPNGTIVPARGSYLLVGSAYSLGTYAVADQTFTSDVENDANVGLFNSATTFTVATRLDAVGFGSNTGTNCDTLREGTNLAAAGGSTSQYSFVRKVGAGGLPQDTNNNSADFAVVSNTPTVAVGSNATPVLGAPGPENTLSLLQRTSLFAVGLIEPNALSTDPPNRVRDTNQTALITAPNAGTLEIRRRYTNNTGGTVTRLRFRITGITTLNSPVIYTGQADIRSLTTSDFTITTSLGLLTVKGTVLESPSDQGTTGGGLNSSLTVALPGGGLANGQTLDVNFLLGIKTNGRFAFNITIEALP